jgi:gluconokinase
MSDRTATPPSSVPARRWVVMGVSGCGKSEIGRRLAERVGAVSIEGDEFHSPANIEKMRAGIPLDDADRHAWLLTLQGCLRAAAARDESAVLSCSALKRRYRDILREADPALLFIHLDGERDLIAARMHRRSGHYMPLSLLDSQCRDLEPLQADERGLRLDIADPPERLVEQILERLA